MSQTLSFPVKVSLDKEERILLIGMLDRAIEEYELSKIGKSEHVLECLSEEIKFLEALKAKFSDR